MRVEMLGIVVDFGPVRAVDHVDLIVETGEIRGLIGENGAGKSTLMNVLAGSFGAKDGEIILDGRKVHFTGVKSAMASGIRLIHQELNLCNDLRVFENMYLAQELIDKMGLLDKKSMIERAAHVFERMGVNIDPTAHVSDLQAAQKQLVEIARALLFKCDIIIMDEPTTALSNYEISNLFKIMRQLKDQDVTFIYISHKMPEIFEICDTYTVLRDGKWISTGSISDVTEQEITEMMTGKTNLADDFSRRISAKTEVIAMQAEMLSSKGFEDISFDLHKGEILAITGLQGSGRDDLADALFGVIPHSGILKVNGKIIKGGIRGFLRHHIAMVPRNRKERGILNDLNIYDNMSMGYFNTRMKDILIKPNKEKSRYIKQKLALDIRADNAKNLITSLSGGNQQKVILGRWLEADADILLFDNPTQGIDVGTKFEIYHLLLRLAAQGKTILVFSSEFPEIMKVADRCMVLYKGKMNAMLERKDITEERMMLYSTGANFNADLHTKELQNVPTAK
ncbi:MAG: sugar ABC transporter ATP-binding protein [Clostridiales bacterium]|nr:sugar ABC transporter ATP-binding protein [Clostridiales bacterium]